MMGFVLYILILVAAVFYLPEIYFDPAATQFVLALGVLSIWRYSWSLTHFFRALIYRKFVFPKLRKRADDLGDAAKPEHVFLVLTTFRIGTQVSVEVYLAAVKDAISTGVPTTIIASIVELSEERLIRKLFELQNPPSHLRLKIVRINGSGKRDALAAAFRAVSNTPVSLEKSVVSVIDGDSILPLGLTDACYRMFALQPKLGALTTDEICRLDGDDFATSIYRRWYSMRFAQRHTYMSSMGLSRRVLTLTGRMSMFRANIVGQAGFIDAVQLDHLNHWRLGQFRFLTGDDKSSWFYLLKNGWEMWYVPDVEVLTIEEIPHQNFFLGAHTLMRRWFGNMLRTNRRALSVPIRVMGFFTWWNLIDQRISMWTSLFGLCAGIITAIVYGAELLIVYLWWVACIRLLQTLMLRASRKHISITWPFFIYFNQIYGSLIKVYMLNHLNKQRWTRQKTSFKQRGSQWNAWYVEFSSKLSMFTYASVFITSVAVITGTLNAENFQQAISFFYEIL
jgi:glycosyltransferase Alg8